MQLKHNKPIRGLCGPKDDTFSIGMFVLLAFYSLSLGGPTGLMGTLAAIGMLVHDRFKVAFATADNEINQTLPDNNSKAKKRLKGTPNRQLLSPSPPPTMIIVPETQTTNISSLTAFNHPSIPIDSLIHASYVAIVGSSSSGKTTLATMINAARLADSKTDTLVFVTADGDIPDLYKNWGVVYSKKEAYTEYITELVELIETSERGELSHLSVHLDEFLAATKQFCIDINPLMCALTTRGTKTGIRVITVSHTSTVSSHNMQAGFSDALVRDRVLIEATRVKDAKSRYSPSGSYTVQFPDESPTVWSWPDYMQGIDPVATLGSDLSTLGEIKFA